MTKKLLLVIILISSVVTLFCSITQSPNGHIYEHVYSYYENFNPPSDYPIFQIVPNMESAPRSFTYTTHIKMPLTGQTSYGISVNGFGHNEYRFYLYVDGELLNDPNNPSSLTPAPDNFHAIYGPRLTVGNHKIRVMIRNMVDYSFDETMNVNVLPPHVNSYINPNGDQIYYMNSTPPSTQIKKPLLIVEGFDPLNTANYSDYASLTNNLAVFGLNGSPTDYDVYLLNLHDCRKDMRDNAMAVLGAIRFIHTLYNSNTMAEHTRVLGFSMGGILARYALAFAEDNNIEHYCGQLITYDSPHRGAALNPDFQTMVEQSGSYTNQYPWMQNMLGTQLRDCDVKYIGNFFNNKSAKQFIRLNTHALTSSDTYLTGTTDFKDFFSEINPEERAIYLPNNRVLNQDPNNSQAKPGFPYKQNNIKCLAIANGSLNCSGNIAGSQYLAQVNIPGHNYNALSREYDSQPGSVTGMLPLSSSNTLLVNYDPVFVPFKSSLYLKTADLLNNGANDPQFDIGLFNNIQTPPNVDIKAYLNNHSYFDEILFEPSSTNPSHQWIHSYINSSVTMNSFINWSHDAENIAFTHISGYIADSNPGAISVEMYFNNQLLATTTCLANLYSGYYELPITCPNSATYTLIFRKPGAFPVVKNLDVSFTNGVIQYSPIENVVMHNATLGNLYVSHDEQADYPSVAKVIEDLTDYVRAGSYDGSTIKINLRAGVYHENIDLTPLVQINADGFTPIIKFTLQGIGDVTINGDNQNYCVRLNNDSDIDFERFNCRIKNLHFTNAKKGIIFADSLATDGSPHTFLTIENCSFDNLGMMVNNTTPNYYGGAVYFKGAGSIINSVFTNNRMISNHSGNRSVAGALYVTNDSNESLIITGNHFTNNQGSKSGAIYVTGKGEIDFSNNTLQDNLHVGYNTGEKSNNLYVDACPRISIKNNNFINAEEGCSVVLLAIGQSVSDAQPLEFINNVVDGNSVRFWRTGNPCPQDVIIKNNVFTANTAGNTVLQSLNWGTPSVTYNLFHNVSTVGFTPTPTSNNRYADPCLDSLYFPEWTESTMSVCIDNGDPTIRDYDGTPSDIGSAIITEHNYDEYAMPVGNYNSGIKWMSFPVLNRVTSACVVNQNFFEQITYPSILNKVTWKTGKQPLPTSMEFYQGNLLNGNYTVSSPQGYKVQVQATYTNPASIKVPGTLESPTHPVQLYALDTNGNRNENWIGYFQEDSALPLDAFAPIIDDVLSIQTQTWSMARDPRTGKWIMPGSRYTINYGDMVIVKVKKDCTLVWNGTVPTNPKSRVAAQQFTYTEKEDYTPLYLTVDSSATLPSEIGVYVDGVCKGAVTVENDSTDICVYLDEEQNMTPENTELVLYYNTRALPNYKAQCKLGSNKFESVNRDGLKYYTATIKRSDIDNPPTPTTSLAQNYPNPFNPRTTICYQVEKDSKVRLEIFNIKGQLVRSLVNASKGSGFYDVEWDGRDNNGSSCASGVYYYRMIADGKKLTKKMLMLK